MRTIFLAVSFLLPLTFLGCSAETAESHRAEPKEEPAAIIETRQPVLVELFTSEGCSSCPPADRVLTNLEKQQPVSQAEVITLAFHVDYWNYLGWKDEFSSPAFGQRQGQYVQSFRLDSNYTPQMVVDGQTEFVGSHSDKASEAIVNAAKIRKGTVAASINADKLKVSITGLPKHENATVFLAIAEDGLATNVKRGENAGSNLQHTSVVRELKQLGSIGSETDSHTSEADIQISPAWKRENLKFVVFVQENSSKKVIAAGKAK